GTGGHRPGLGADEGHGVPGGAQRLARSPAHQPRPAGHQHAHRAAPSMRATKTQTRGAPSRLRGAERLCQTSTMTMPLDGIRVIDWTIWHQGPVASVMLGALGADVINLGERVSGYAAR